MALLNKKVPQTVDQAIAGLNKIVTDLQEVVRSQAEQAQIKTDKISALTLEATAHNDESNRAAKIAEKFASIFE